MDEVKISDDCDCPPRGLPPYMATLADLMALLMCFFVLLLSFAEMDALKFKRLAGSLKMAFGVQREVVVNEIPMGTSIVVQEFSPAQPEPTPLNRVTQNTAQELQQHLQRQPPGQSDASLTQDAARQQLVEKLETLLEQTRRDAVDLANALAPQIRRDEVELETRGRDITIRIKEKGSFSSGSADLQPGFVAVLHDVRDVLAEKSGKIVVQGHSDNVAISTARFRSNWELSSVRAASVARELLVGDILDSQRFTVSGFSDTRPLVENDSAARRARNRRVEIVVRQSVDTVTRMQLESLREEDPSLYPDLDRRLRPQFEIDPEAFF